MHEKYTVIMSMFSLTCSKYTEVVFMLLLYTAGSSNHL